MNSKWFLVTPAEAGVQARRRRKRFMDSGLRRNDEHVVDTLQMLGMAVLPVASVGVTP